MLVKKDRQKFTVRSSPLVVTLDGGEEFPSNVRLATSEVILELVDTLLEQGSDDTKALCHAVNVRIIIIVFVLLFLRECRLGCIKHH